MIMAWSIMVDTNLIGGDSCQLIAWAHTKQPNHITTYIYYYANDKIILDEYQPLAFKTYRKLQEHASKASRYDLSPVCKRVGLHTEI